MKLHNILDNRDCVGQRVKADIPVGLEWVDYPDDGKTEVAEPDGTGAYGSDNIYRDVYTEGGLLAFCQGETCEIKAFDEHGKTVTLLNNDPERCLDTGGYNAAEFVLPYDRYAACFGTDWPVLADGVHNRTDTKDREKTSVLDAIRTDRQKPRQSKTADKKVKSYDAGRE